MSKTEEIIEQAYLSAIRVCFDTLIGSLAGSGNDQEKRQAAKNSYACCVTTAKEARDAALKISIESTSIPEPDQFLHEQNE